jgi:hypothetical protein
MLQCYFHMYIACLDPIHYKQYYALENLCGISPNHSRSGVSGIKSSYAKLPYTIIIIIIIIIYCN